MQTSSKVLLLSVILCLWCISLYAASSPFAFDHYGIVTIDRSKVGGTANITNKPILVKLTASNFTFSSCDASGYSVRAFKSDATTPLLVDVERWDSVNSLAEIWVSGADWVVNGSSASTDTTFYLCWSATTTATAYPSSSGLYDSSYKAIWHMTDVTTATFADSSGTGNNCTKQSAGHPAVANSVIGKGQDFASNDQAYTTTTSASTGSQTQITVEFFMNADNLTGYHFIMGKRGYPSEADYSGWYDIWTSDDELFIEFAGVGDIGYNHITTNANLATGTNYYIKVEYDWTNNTINVYKGASGVAVAACTMDATAETHNPGASNARAFNFAYYTTDYKYAGLLDEVRITAGLRTLQESQLLCNNAFNVPTTVGASASYGSYSYKVRKLTLNGIGRITGTLSTSTTAVTGSGTYFTDWLVGDQLQIPSGGTWYTISAIADDTHCTLSATAGTNSTVAYYARHVDYPVKLSLMKNRTITPLVDHFKIKSTNSGEINGPSGAFGVQADKFDALGVSPCKVLYFADSVGTGPWKMLYWGWDTVAGGAERCKVGLATSPDLTNGGTWTRYVKDAGNPGLVLDAPPGRNSIYPWDCYKVGSTFYLICQIGNDDLAWDATTPFPFEMWVYSSTDLINWTEYGWSWDWYDLGIAKHMSGASPLLLNDGTPLTVSGYYLQTGVEVTADYTYKPHLLTTTSLDQRKESYTGTVNAYATVYGVTTSAYKACQTFTATGEKLTQISLSLSKQGSPTGNINVNLYAVDVNHKPTGSSLVSSYLATSCLTTSAARVSFRINNAANYQTVNATEYAIVVSASAANDSSNYIKVHYNSAGSSGYAWTCTDGSTWSAVTGAFYFILAGSGWTDNGVIYDPEANSTTNTFAAGTAGELFDTKLMKYGDQYIMSVSGGGNGTAYYNYFATTETPLDLSSWKLEKRPIPYKNAYPTNGRNAVYFEEETNVFHCWWGMPLSGLAGQGKILYFENDPNTAISCTNNVRYDYSDVRFYKSDASTLLNHFISSIAQDYAKVWVNVDYIPPTGETKDIYVSYGNSPSSGGSSGSGTFSFFDAFASATNWTTSGIVTTGGDMDMVASASAISATTKATYAPGYAFGTISILGTNSDANFYGNYIGIQDAAAANPRYIRNYPYDSVMIESQTVASTFTHARSDTGWETEIKYPMDGKGYYYLGDLLEYTDTNVMAGSKYIHLMLNYTGWSSYDWIYARKALPVEPTWQSFGAETSSGIMNSLLRGAFP